MSAVKMLDKLLGRPCCAFCEDDAARELVAGELEAAAEELAARHVWGRFPVLNIGSRLSRLNEMAATVRGVPLSTVVPLTPAQAAAPLAWAVEFAARLNADGEVYGRAFVVHIPD